MRRGTQRVQSRPATIDHHMMRVGWAVLGLILVAALQLPAAHAQSTIVVTHIWSRPARGSAVVYATITNTGSRADRLIAATSPGAKSVELHESMAVAAPADSMNGMPMNGAMMSMTSLASIAIPPHARRILAPGGYHLMLVGLRQELRAESTIPLRLHFAAAGWVVVEVHVRPT